MQNRAPITLAVAFPSAQLRPMTGQVELALGDAMSQPMSRPEVVTAVLDAMFWRVGGRDVTPDLLDQLATGARAWLLMRAARVFHGMGGWFTAHCPTCKEPFDLQIDLKSLPRSSAGPQFPIVAVQTSLGERQFEVPNGQVEIAIAYASQPDERALAILCGMSQTADVDADAFTADDLALIEAALDAATPDVADEIATTCPACNATVQALIDPLTFAFPSLERLDHDVHLLAQSYAWDEPTILKMPTDRRRRHARLIRQSKTPEARI